MKIPEIARSAVPELPSENVVLAVVPALMVPKLCEPGARLATGSGTAVPLPASVTTCGEPEASLAIEIEPARGPVAVGKNFTCSTQLLPAASVSGVAQPRNW